MQSRITKLNFSFSFMFILIEKENFNLRHIYKNIWYKISQKIIINNKLSWQMCMCIVYISIVILLLGIIISYPLEIREKRKSYEARDVVFSRENEAGSRSGINTRARSWAGHMAELISCGSYSRGARSAPFIQAERSLKPRETFVANTNFIFRTPTHVAAWIYGPVVFKNLHNGSLTCLCTHRGLHPSCQTPGPFWVSPREVLVREVRIRVTLARTKL